MINERGNFYLYLWNFDIREILNFKLKSCTLLSNVLKVEFSGEFCSDIESISTILSGAWNKTNSSTPIFRFLGDFLGMLGNFKSDGLDFGALWIVGTGCNLCTQMATHFSAEMKIQSKNYNTPIFSYSKNQKKKFNTNINLAPEGFKKVVLAPHCFAENLYLIWFINWSIWAKNTIPSKTFG